MNEETAPSMSKWEVRYHRLRGLIQEVNYEQMVDKAWLTSYLGDREGFQSHLYRQAGREIGAILTLHLIKRESDEAWAEIYKFSALTIKDRKGLADLDALIEREDHPFLRVKP